MKKSEFAFLGCFLAFFVANSQADHKLHDQTIQNNNVIMEHIIQPALASANQNRQEPDWKALRTVIVGRY